MIDFAQRLARYDAIGRQVRALATGTSDETTKLSRIGASLAEAVAEPGLFPPQAFPVYGAFGGGLYRLIEFPDHRGTVYVSVGVTGRRQTPHSHKSWAIVAGISGGVEENIVFSAELEEASQTGRLTRLRSASIGPGDVEPLAAGEYHSINVDSDVPVLHLHVYDASVDEPYRMPMFDAATDGPFAYLDTTKFDPPYSQVTLAEAKTAVAAGRARIISAAAAALPPALGAIAMGGGGGSIASFDAAGIGHEQAIIVHAPQPEAHTIARRIGARGHHLVFVSPQEKGAD